MTEASIHDALPSGAMRNHSITESGFAIFENVVDEETIHRLLVACDGEQTHAHVSRQGGLYAIRDLFAIVPAVRAVAESAALRALVEPVLGPSCFPVRALFFDKLPEANWKVPWHQDLCIAVRQRREVPGFGPWSEKAGVPHAHAPVPLLARMLTVRLHLDLCDEENGPLRVLPGTHRLGKLNAAQRERCRAEIAEVRCIVGRGGALAMRPLLLHASSPARAPHHRRVIHLEFAAEPLPDGLEWHAYDRAP